MKNVDRFFTRYTIAIGLLFAVTVAFLVTRGNVADVEVRRVERMQLVQAVYATGYVDADQMADLRTEMSGSVGKVLVQEGASVTRGDGIISLDTSQPGIAVRDARAALRSAESKAREVSRRFERTRNLFAAGAVTRQALDEVEQEYVEVQKAVEQQRLELLFRQEDLEKVSVAAPIDGIIGFLDARQGDYLPQNTLVATVIDPSSYVVSVDIDELDVPKVRVGQEATVAFDALPVERFPAKVARIVPKTDRVTKTSRVYLELAEGFEGLQVGMTATANIVYDTIDDALLLPRIAVFEERQVFYTWVVRDGRLVRQRIVPGAGDLDYIQVKEGVEAGELCVIQPPETLKEGMEARYRKPDDV